MVGPKFRHGLIARLLEQCQGLLHLVAALIDVGQGAHRVDCPGIVIPVFPDPGIPYLLGQGNGLVGFPAER